LPKFLRDGPGQAGPERRRQLPPTVSDLDRFKPAIDEIRRADLAATGLA
jgi:hypothetical protein